MSAIILCPVCMAKLVSHMPHQQTPWHLKPITNTICPGTGQVGIPPVS